MPGRIPESLEQYNYISVMLQDKDDYYKYVEALLEDTDDVDVVENILKEGKLRQTTSLTDELSSILARIINSPSLFGTNALYASALRFGKSRSYAAMTAFFRECCLGKVSASCESEGKIWTDREERERHVRFPEAQSDGRRKSSSEHLEKEKRAAEAANESDEFFGNGPKPVDKYAEETPPPDLPEHSSSFTSDEAGPANPVEPNSESLKKEQRRKKRKRCSSPPWEWVYIDRPPPRAFTEKTQFGQTPETSDIYESVEERGAKRPRPNVEDPVEEDTESIDSLLSLLASSTRKAQYVPTESLPFCGSPSSYNSPNATGTPPTPHSSDSLNASYGSGNSVPSYYSLDTSNESSAPRDPIPHVGPPPHFDPPRY
ncbi:MAG: hypothetical protein Q9157_007710 [Trypethelium eluteriae]